MHSSICVYTDTLGGCLYANWGQNDTQHAFPSVWLLLLSLYFTVIFFMFMKYYSYHRNCQLPIVLSTHYLNYLKSSIYNLDAVLNTQLSTQHNEQKSHGIVIVGHSNMYLLISLDTSKVRYWCKIERECNNTIYISNCYI